MELNSQVKTLNSKWEATYEIKEYDEDIIANHKDDMDFYLYNPAGVLIVRGREGYENQNSHDEILGTGFPWDPPWLRFYY